MAILKRLDKRTNIVYVYESSSYWDKKKKQPRSKRVLIGKIDPKTDEMIPTDGRCKHLSTEGKKQAQEKEAQDKAKQQAAREKEDKKLITNARRYFFGATYLLDAIAEKTGLTSDLKRCFPETYRQLLSLAYYLILEDSAALSRFSRWAVTHEHPYGSDIPSQRSSEILRSVTEGSKMEFFRCLAKRRKHEEYWAYDSTSISSYSEQLNQVKYGHNKDHEPLPQLNLLLLYGESSNLPFYYRKLAGNIPDVKTVRTLIADVEPLGVKKVKLLMDRGFYSSENIDSMLANHYKFLIGTSTTLAEVKRMIKEHGNTMRNLDNYDTQHDVFCISEKVDWLATKRSKRETSDVQVTPKRMYIHLYFNHTRAAEDEKNFMKRMAALRDELENNERVSTHEAAYAKYFKVSKVKGGAKIEINRDAMQDAQARFGYFALMSNEIKDAREALLLYRNRDVVEKAFSNIKERLNGNRLLVSSEDALEGKLFVHFIGLFLLSYIKKQMQEHAMFSKYTMSSLLDELDVIERIHIPGKTPIVREILNKQIQIYKNMAVKPPIDALS